MVNQMARRGDNKFNQREITRTIKAIEAAGGVAGYVDITKDGARVGIRQDNGEAQEPKLSNEWDEALGKTPAKVRK
jgi:hypothetical protein